MQHMVFIHMIDLSALFSNFREMIRKWKIKRVENDDAICNNMAQTVRVQGKQT